MRRCIGLVLLFGAATGWAAAPPGKPRALTAQEEKEVAALRTKLVAHALANEFEQAARVAEQIASYRRQHQGGGHLEAINARLDAEDWRRLVAVPVKDRAEVVRARKLNGEGAVALNAGRYQ